MAIASIAPKIYSDYNVALAEFVIVRIADRYGITGEAVFAEFDLEVIASNVLMYDSINGKEGFRTDPQKSDRFWEIVEMNHGL